jgi:hypothetical protein
MPTRLGVHAVSKSYGIALFSTPSPALSPRAGAVPRAVVVVSHDRRLRQRRRGERGVTAGMLVTDSATAGT